MSMKSIEHGDFEAKYAVVEVGGAVKVGDAQMLVADACAGMDRFAHTEWMYAGAGFASNFLVNFS
jgi:hypothetical protein